MYKGLLCYFNCINLSSLQKTPKLPSYFVLLCTTLLVSFRSNSYKMSLSSMIASVVARHWSSLDVPELEQVLVMSTYQMKIEITFWNLFINILYFFLVVRGHHFLPIALIIMLCEGKVVNALSSWKRISPAFCLSWIFFEKEYHCSSECPLFRLSEEIPPRETTWTCLYSIARSKPLPSQAGEWWEGGKPLAS